jgi:hypothetical protein
MVPCCTRAGRPYSRMRSSRTRITRARGIDVPIAMPGHRHRDALWDTRAYHFRHAPPVWSRMRADSA